MLAWHFLPCDGRLQFGCPRALVTPGQTLRRDPAKLSMCNYGLHASMKIIDALQYAPGPIVCRVRLGGKIIEGDNKVVASRRTVLWMANADHELMLFACWSVRNTPLADGRVVWDLLTDKRSQTAVEVAERYADGLVTNDELDAARNEAINAARDTAWVTLLDAANDPSLAAAYDASRVAAWSAVWSASRGATWSAAWDASRAASVASAWAASRDAQNAQLEKMLLRIEIVR